MNSKYRARVICRFSYSDGGRDLKYDLPNTTGRVGNSTEMLLNMRAAPAAHSPLSRFFFSLWQVLPIDNVIVTEFHGRLLYIVYLFKF